MHTSWRRTPRRRRLASPPPLWGRDSVGGRAELSFEGLEETPNFRSSARPPSSILPHKAIGCTHLSGGRHGADDWRPRPPCGGGIGWGVALNFPSRGWKKRQTFEVRRDPPPQSSPTRLLDAHILAADATAPTIGVPAPLVGAG